MGEIVSACLSIPIAEQVWRVRKMKTGVRADTTLPVDCAIIAPGNMTEYCSWAIVAQVVVKF